MGEIGEILRQAREERQLSLAEVESKIKIRKRYLEALERGNYIVFPGNVYMFGFLRNYATFLNLDGEELVRKLKSDLGEEKEEVVAPKQKKDSSYYNTINKSDFNYTKLLKYLLIIVVLILVGLYFFYYFTNEPNNEFVPPKDVLEENTKEVVPPTEQEIGETVEPGVKQGIHLLLRVSEEQGARCWVEVKIDGELSYSGTIEQGEEMPFQGREKINVRLGNAGVVTLIYNDENIGLAGSIDEVVDLEFPEA